MSEPKHDMSIHTHDVYDTLGGGEFADYLDAWGATPMRPENDMDLLICMKESGGYREDWRVVVVDSEGYVDRVVRVR